jgi:TetR/AcrR family transcriptional regulator, cholesterol catabolism regulator
MPTSNRKKLIREKAAHLFRSKGYNATSMRDIADAVGVEAASLYNHIKSKTDLLEYIIFNVADSCNQHLEYIKNDATHPAAQLESVIRFHVQLMIHQFNDYYVMTHDWQNLQEPHLTRFALDRRKYVQHLESIVAFGIERNIFKPLSPYVVVLNILSAIMGLEFWHRSNKKYTEQEIEQNMVGHLLSGLIK